jgi:hypothetical protein
LSGTSTYTGLPELKVQSIICHKDENVEFHCRR